MFFVGRTDGDPSSSPAPGANRDEPPATSWTRWADGARRSNEPAAAFIVDLTDPAAGTLVVRAGDGGMAWGPDGQLTLASNPAGDLDLVDAASETVRQVPVPNEVDVDPWLTADGSGWYRARSVSTDCSRRPASGSTPRWTPEVVASSPSPPTARRGTCTASPTSATCANSATERCAGRRTGPGCG